MSHEPCARGAFPSPGPRQDGTLASDPEEPHPAGKLFPARRSSKPGSRPSFCKNTLAWFPSADAVAPIPAFVARHHIANDPCRRAFVIHRTPNHLRRHAVPLRWRCQDDSIAPASRPIRRNTWTLKPPQEGRRIREFERYGFLPTQSLPACARRFDKLACRGGIKESFCGVTNAPSQRGIRAIFHTAAPIRQDGRSELRRRAIRSPPDLFRRA